MKKLTFILLILLVGCTKPLFDNGYVRYSTNGHYVAHPQIPEFNDYVKISFIPNSSWYYETEHNGWSKIFGYSDGDHRKNSNRLGFQCRDGKLYAGFYCYVDGYSPQDSTWQKGNMMELICDVKHTAEIYRRNHKYCIKLWNYKEEAMIEIPAGPNAVGYLLFPYIGGQYTINGFYVDLKIYN